MVQNPDGTRTVYQCPAASGVVVCGGHTWLQFSGVVDDVDSGVGISGQCVQSGGQ